MDAADVDLEKLLASSTLAERFQELLRVLADQGCPQQSVRRLGNDFLEQLVMLPRAHFAPPEATESISLDTVLGKSPGVICRFLLDGEQAFIQFPSGLVGGPARIAPALQFVAQSNRFKVRELPGGIGDDAKIVLARRLVREGLLIIVQEAERTVAPATTFRCRGRKWPILLLATASAT